MDFIKTIHGFESVLGLYLPILGLFCPILGLYWPVFRLLYLDCVGTVLASTNVLLKQLNSIKNDKKMLMLLVFHTTKANDIFYWFGQGVKIN